MKPFAKIPGVTYPPASSPEATIDRSVTVHPICRTPKNPLSRHVEVNGRNLSSTWLKRHGLCVRAIAGVPTVVPITRRKPL